MATITHRWTLDEDLKCCRMYLECFVLIKSAWMWAVCLAFEKELPNISPTPKNEVQVNIFVKKALKIRRQHLSQTTLNEQKAMNVALEEMGL